MKLYRKICLIIVVFFLMICVLISKKYAILSTPKYGPFEKDAEGYYTYSEYIYDEYAYYSGPSEDEVNLMNEQLNIIKSKGPSLNRVVYAFLDPISGVKGAGVLKLRGGRNDVYCINHDNRLLSGFYNRYFVSHYVRIDGNLAYDDLGNLKQGSTETEKTNEKILNAKLAYVLHEKGGMGYYNQEIEDMEFSKSQKGLYAMINDWFTGVGKYFNGSGAKSNLSQWVDPANGGSNHPEDYDEAYEREAEEYANKILNYNMSSSTSTVTDNTKNVSFTRYDRNNKSYFRIGPFNWNFSGSVSSVTVKTNNGNLTGNNLLISVFDGNTERFISQQEIQSNKQFYISIEATPRSNNCRKSFCKFCNSF